ncbi:MAG: hypothetical protein K0S04_317 [Herbinix sp.]|jgi:hypothetical protein|nr:hypothetical protein [Herbinix sp.]
MDLQEGKWSYNRPHDEYWNRGLFDTKEEAEKEAIEYGKECGIPMVEVGECTLLSLPNYIDSDDILEKLQQQYSDEAGGEYEDDLYDDVKKEDLEWLEEQISKVIDAFHERAKVESNWYTVSNVYEVNVN